MADRITTKRETPTELLMRLFADKDFVEGNEKILVIVANPHSNSLTSYHNYLGDWEIRGMILELYESLGSGLLEENENDG